MSPSCTNDASIGVFDSGVGGLTVLKQLRLLMPQETFVYFGDTARVPYGNKSAKTILRYSLECAHFLLRQNIKLLIVACNTACAYALETLQKELPVPVLGVIQPVVEHLKETPNIKSMAVLATAATIASETYQGLIRQVLPFVQLFPIPCPLFVPLVEEGFLNHPITRLTIQEYLLPLKDVPLDAAILACTHYPLLLSAIQEHWGSSVKLLDPAMFCARQAKEILSSIGQLAGKDKRGACTFFVSDDWEKFRKLGERFLGVSMDRAPWIHGHLYGEHSAIFQ